MPEGLSEQEIQYHLGIYAAWGCGAAVCVLVRSIIFAFARIKASRVIHENLYDSVVKAPMSFFDRTPLGRIINRFARDINALDQELPRAFGQSLGTTFSLFGALFGIVFATKGWFMIPMVPILIVYYIAQKGFRKTTIELQRVESLSRSPVFAHFSTTLSGMATIRSVRLYICLSVCLYLFICVL